MTQQGKIRDAEPLVNGFAAAHGDYRPVATLGAERAVMLNRGGSAIARWMNEADSPLFTEQVKIAVRYCQALWQMVDRKGPPDLSGVKSSLWIGQTEHEALAELALLKLEFMKARDWWECFENVCRFELDASQCGRKFMNNKRSASDAAKVVTAMVGNMIAMSRGF